MSSRNLAILMPAALALSACGEAPAPAPDPQVLEQFIARIEAQDREARAAAVADARREEQARIEASEKRLDRYRNSAEKVFAAPATAEGAVKALAGG